MRFSLSALFIIALSSCQLVGGRGPSPEPPRTRPAPAPEPQVPIQEPEPIPFDPETGKVYQGFLEIDGGEMRAALQLVREGRRRLWGALQASSGLQAEGSGTLRGEVFDLDLRYGGACPGRLLLEGSWDQEAEILSGTVQATDCTGSADGAFRFSGY